MKRKIYDKLPEWKTTRAGSSAVMIDGARRVGKSWIAEEFAKNEYPAYLIIFDEVQRFPRAREAIKYLVADGRYHYIETGPLISINKNVKNIVIPSEEHHLLKPTLTRGHNLMPVEVKSIKDYTTTSLDKFRAKFGEQLCEAVVLHPKDVRVADGVTYIPLYMTPLPVERSHDDDPMDAKAGDGND